PVDTKCAPGHTATDPLDPLRVAPDLDLVASVTLDLEELVETPPPFAEKNRQRTDLIGGQRHERVRRQHLGLERHARGFFEGESNHRLGASNRITGDQPAPFTCTSSPRGRAAAPSPRRSSRTTSCTPSRREDGCSSRSARRTPGGR